MKNILLSLLLTNIFVLIYAQTGEMTAREIVDTSQKLTRVEGMEMISTLKIIDPKGRERIRKIATASLSKGDPDKTIMKFLEPADVQGTGILIYDYEHQNDDMWIYMPALRKTRRLVSSEKARSFMGSEFSNGDMSIPNLDDFKFSITGTSRIEDVECYIIESVPLNDQISEENGFSKKLLYVGKNDLLARKIDYYNLDGALNKELLLRDYELVDESSGKYIATEMFIENVQNDRKSIFNIEQYQFNRNLKDDLFTTFNLEK